jgi:thiamine-phosphate pyrophosphorylase
VTFRLPKIYPITDRLLSGMTHAEQVRELVRGGARFIQLREKHAPSGRFLDEAREAVAAAAEFQAKIIINDRVDIALMSGAAGVHLGQTDLPPAEARRLLGAEAVIGYSTHSVEQAVEAKRMPVDYIAVGPVYPTDTKEDTEPVVGIAGVADVRNAVGDVPLTAIGGITHDRIAEVLNAGADSIAVISALYRKGVPIADAYSSLARLV